MAHTGTGKYEQLLERCRGYAPIPTAVADDPDSLRSRIASCAVAVLAAHTRREAKP